MSENVDKNQIDKKILNKLIKMDYSYPAVDDPHFQKKIYEKREFYYHKTPQGPSVEKYEDIKEYRDNICARNFSLHEHQAMLSNFINPDTPYKGALVFHGLGSGKTCVGVAIGEKFKYLVQKYNTKILVLVGGPLIKENWKQHILICTGDTYLKYQDKSVYVDEAEKAKNEKNALMQALQYYKFMSYKSFYKHVIGEKITDKQSGKKGKAIYRKTDEGEFERDISVDRIYNLNNTLIIVDEAHNLTGNAYGTNTYGDALKQIIANSQNLKVVLLTGTPMKNLGSDIVGLMNFLRPVNNPMERDKIFTSTEKGHLMDFKPGGLDYLKNMMRGYVSHVRGGDPLTFAKRVDKGVKPDGLLFTKLIRCTMLPFQRKTYDEAIEHKHLPDEFDGISTSASDSVSNSASESDSESENENEQKNIGNDAKKRDALDRKSEAVANFVFPALSNDKKSIVGKYAGDGLDFVKNQLKSHSELLNKKLSKEIFGHEKEKDLITIGGDGRSISGKIFHMKYLKMFSIKFYKALKKLERLVWGKKGPATAFVYSNLVRVGINVFSEILLQNGYLEYQEDYTNYNISPNTICYFCGQPHSKHGAGKQSIDSDSGSESDNDSDDGNNPLKRSDSSSDYQKKKKTKQAEVIPPHTFAPATFITVTGKSSEESMEAMPEDKMNIIKNAFNILENKDGRHIKFVLGSRVMNEGISLKNVGEVHILDAYFNFGRIDQVVGRAIRHCSHYKLMNENNVYPFVNVYKYVVALDGALSTEEELYQKAELKYLLIKKIERAMKEIAIDCPLNLHANMFQEEIDKYKDCGEDGKEACPAICDYTHCSYKCDDSKLNYDYYDQDRKIYKKIAKDKLDYSTFTHGLARDEIEYAKDKIKDMYITENMYKLPDILFYVKQSYNEDKRDLFDEFFVYKALDELIPMAENDFNNFKDTIVDKHNRQGYLIYRDEFYIYQSFDQNENIPMYYRTHVTHNITQQMSLYNLLQTTTSYKVAKGKKNEEKNLVKEEQSAYNFDDTMDYYDNRDEHEFVGIIDKEVSRRKIKSNEEIKDVFKLREKRAKILEKKRATGIPSLKGAVCSTSKSKKYLDDLMKKLGVIKTKQDTRTDVCTKIEGQMLLLEKYGTAKSKTKRTYVMIPIDHPLYPFPYNLEDRVEYNINKIKNELGSKIDINVKTEKKTSGPEKGQPSYILTFKDDAKTKEHASFLEKLHAEKKGGSWTLLLE